MSCDRWHFEWMRFEDVKPNERQLVLIARAVEEYPQLAYWTCPDPENEPLGIWWEWPANVPIIQRGGLDVTHWGHRPSLPPQRVINTALAEAMKQHARVDPFKQMMKLKKRK